LKSHRIAFREIAKLSPNNIAGDIGRRREGEGGAARSRKTPWN
jgi:hypothetical protein